MHATGRERSFALALIAVGALAALFVRASSPARRPPLYDGVVVEDPYLWLDPPPGYPGGAEGTSDTVDVVAGENRIVAIFTDELPPQAQVLAQRGALKVAADATSLTVTITPIEVSAAPAGGYIDGNVYEIDVVDQLGHAASPRKGADVSVVLRPADSSLLDGTIEQFDGTTWHALATGGGGPFAYEAVVPGFGDFAVVGNGASPYPSAAPSLAPTPASNSGAPPSATAAPTPLPATPAATSSPASAADAGIPIGSIAAIVAGVLGLIALFVLFARPSSPADRRRGR